MPVTGSREKVKISLHRKEVESVCKDLYVRAREAVDKCCLQAGIILAELIDELKKSNSVILKFKIKILKKYLIFRMKK